VERVSGKGRILVFAFGCESSGIPPNWAALVESCKPSAGAMTGISTQRTVGAVLSNNEIPDSASLYPGYADSSSPVRRKRCVRVERRVSEVATPGRQAFPRSTSNVEKLLFLEQILTMCFLREARLMVRLPLLNDQAVDVLKMAISCHKC
jgi:hypothetical protein